LLLTEFHHYMGRRTTTKNWFGPRSMLVQKKQDGLIIRDNMCAGRPIREKAACQGLIGREPAQPVPFDARHSVALVPDQRRKAWLKDAASA
jgi:hypothetical protein